VTPETQQQPAIKPLHESLQMPLETVQRESISAPPQSHRESTLFSESRVPISHHEGSRTQLPHQPQEKGLWVNYQREDHLSLPQEAVVASGSTSPQLHQPHKTQAAEPWVNYQKERQSSVHPEHGAASGSRPHQPYQAHKLQEAEPCGHHQAETQSSLHRETLASSTALGPDWQKLSNDLSTPFEPAAALQSFEHGGLVNGCSDVAATHDQTSAETPPCPEPAADSFEHRLSEEPSAQLQSVEQDLQLASYVHMLLIGNSMCAHARSQLPLVLPNAVVQQALVPSGFLADVAQRFHVMIDLGGEVLPAGRHVLLTGTVAANAAAAFCIQEGLLRYTRTCA